MGCTNPTRADRRPGSFSVNTRTGRWADFATGDRGGDVVSLAAYLHGLGSRGGPQAGRHAGLAPMNAYAHDPFAPLGRRSRAAPREPCRGA